MTSDIPAPLDELLRQREAHLGKALSIAHGKPLHITHGRMQYLYAADGTQYLDLVNNVCHVGHSNPGVVEAGQRQMALLNTIPDTSMTDSPSTSLGSQRPFPSHSASAS